MSYIKVSINVNLGKNGLAKSEETEVKTQITFCCMVKEEGFVILLCFSSKKGIRK